MVKQAPSKKKRWAGIAAAAGLVMLGLLTQCTRVEIKDTLTRPQGNLVWPPSGEAARVRFVANITSPDDLFVRRSWMGLTDLLAGREDLSFAVPFDVHLTEDDLLLVTDPGKSCVHLIDMREHHYRQIRMLGREGGGGTKAGKAVYELRQPIGVTADGNGQIYVSDSMLGNVFVFDRGGNFLRALAPPGLLKRPADLAYGVKTGLLYVADVTAHEVKALRPDGTLIRTIGASGPQAEKLSFPTHVWVQDDGTLLVTSAMDFAIKVFDPSGRFLASFGEHGDTAGYFSRPKGVATDRAGHIYVVDAIFDAFQIFDRRGRLLLTVGQAGSERGELWLPAGIFIDRRNRIFVADQQNHRVAVFQYLEAGTP